MYRPLLPSGDPLLRQPSADIPTATFPVKKLRELVDDLGDTMRKHKGAGISAIQIGVAMRLFVVDRKMLNLPRHLPTVFINPTRVAQISIEGVPPDVLAAEVSEIEGCLSLPDTFVRVIRPVFVGLRFWTLNGACHQAIFANQVSRVVQHEMDHLDGLLIDRFAATAPTYLKT